MEIGLGFQAGVSSTMGRLLPMRRAGSSEEGVKCHGPITFGLFRPDPRLLPRSFYHLIFEVVPLFSILFVNWFYSLLSCL